MTVGEQQSDRLPLCRLSETGARRRNAETLAHNPEVTRPEPALTHAMRLGGVPWPSRRDDRF
jgi:hypothetical protein